MDPETGLDPNVLAVIISTLIVAVGGLVTAVVNGRNSAKKTDVENMVQVSAEERRDTEQKFTLLEQQIKSMGAQLEAQDLQLKNRRTEIERLWGVEVELRQGISKRDDELATLRRQLDAAKLREEELARRVSEGDARTAELAQQVKELSDEREMLHGALRAARIEVPEFKRRGDTGPLGKS